MYCMFTYSRINKFFGFCFSDLRKKKLCLNFRFVSYNYIVLLCTVFWKSIKWIGFTGFPNRRGRGEGRRCISTTHAHATKTKIHHTLLLFYYYY
uniref:Uncharacterized protein n=1 Tax=Daphnia magna TaxID=35525 RepID=A0A0N8CDM3_9CRUS